MRRQAAGICWPLDATVGHIAVESDRVSGEFPADQGLDGVLDCLLVAAGKYRNGAARHWCRTHQTYWGVKADLAAWAASGRQRCARHADKMGYALHPPVIDLAACAGATIAGTADGAMEAAIARAGASTAPLTLRCAALAIRDSGGSALFPGTAIVQVNITPPALLAYSAARAAGQALGCVNCARCAHPHLDLGSFAQTPHRRHYCGNCGSDSTHSPDAMISSPLHALSIKFDGLLTIM
ncbi:hypothetical protein HF313_08880 [Massilia atriviolacea]|uniref:Uncharacterized protein n=1 Tax=Massilia atriviolacea TaxID=2495579 RepID=A0A430HDK4_9BURK|nr:hypothetical protein [Massilia atriviolacea]RSZ55579.1 hypothetical protein EJB06_28920 [Massilia atriviolacea]